MKSKAWRWKFFFILFLTVQIISLSAAKPVLSADPDGPPLQQIVQAPLPTPPARTQVPAPVPTAPAPVPPTPSPVVPPRPVLSPPAGQPRPGGTPRVVFNFDNADLYEVIRVMAEILKISYVIDPKVKGVVNIHTSGQIPTENVFTIFQTILNLNGATAVKKENLYEIVPMSDAKKLGVPSLAVKDPEKLAPEERYTIQIMSLRYIPVAEVSKMIKPFLSDGADIVEHPPHNILMIGDMATNVKKATDIINLFDLDIFSDLRVRIYPVLNADVTEVAEEMERIFSSLEVSTKSGRGVGITFKPIKRINSLLAVSSIPNIFGKVEGWLKELDKMPVEGTKFSVFVYYVQNLKAKDLADVLKEVFMKATPKEKEKEKKPATAEPAPRGVRPTPATATPPPSPGREESTAVPEGEINIVVDETNNSLVIRAFQRDYRTILETIKKLDIYPRQVLIEVLLVDVTLNHDTQFGLEWGRFLTSKLPNAQSIVVGAQPPPDPLTTALTGAVPFGARYAIVDLGERLSAAVRAAAQEGRVSVRISPHILASNNKEAKIQIGSSQPIPTGVFTSTTTVTGAAGVVETAVEYKDIGTILTVTPRISDGGLVTMEITIEDSSLGPSVPTGPLTVAPSFNKTIAKTVLSISEGQSIALGGLIRDTKDVSTSGIPVLNKIPLIGFLFGTKTRLLDKREMILLLTPHIIKDQSQSNAVTQEFKDKVEGLKREIERGKEKINKK